MNAAGIHNQCSLVRLMERKSNCLLPFALLLCCFPQRIPSVIQAADLTLKNQHMFIVKDVQKIPRSNFTCLRQTLLSSLEIPQNRKLQKSHQILLWIQFSDFLASWKGINSIWGSPSLGVQQFDCLLKQALKVYCLFRNKRKCY